MTKVKMKSKRVAAKRYKITGTGKVAHRQVNQNHLLSKKSRQRKRRLSLDAVLTGREARTARRLAGKG